MLGYWVVGLLLLFAVWLFGCWAVGLEGCLINWVLFLLLGLMFVIELSCSWVAGLLSCWAVVALGCWAVGLMAGQGF